MATSRTRQRTGTPSAARRETTRRPVRPVAPTTRTFSPWKSDEAAGSAPATAGPLPPPGGRRSGEEVERTSPSEGVASSSSSTSSPAAAATATARAATEKEEGEEEEARFRRRRFCRCATAARFVGDGDAASVVVRGDTRAWFATDVQTRWTARKLMA